MQEISTKNEEKSPKSGSFSDLKVNIENNGSGKGGSFLFINFNNPSIKEWEYNLNMNVIINDIEGVLEQDLHQVWNESNEATYEHQYKTVQQQVRWRKSDDQNLYTCLNEILIKENMSICEFCSYSIKNYKPQILLNLIEKSGWKGSETSFIYRIMKLNNTSKILSSRELKKLRMIYYNQIRNNEIDWSKILFIFPGKDINYLKDLCNNFKRTNKLIKRTKGLVSKNKHANKLATC